VVCGIERLEHRGFELEPLELAIGGIERPFPRDLETVEVNVESSRVVDESLFDLV
jgi:hypothetical protein